MFEPREGIQTSIGEDDKPLTTRCGIACRMTQVAKRARPAFADGVQSAQQRGPAWCLQ